MINVSPAIVAVVIAAATAIDTAVIVFAAVVEIVVIGAINVPVLLYMCCI